MKPILALAGIVVGCFLIHEIINVLKSLNAKKWGITIGTLKNWDINEIEGGDGSDIKIKEFKYTYDVNSKEYESEIIGFGYPKVAGSLFVKNTLEKILENSPKLQVYFNPAKPEISVLSVGFKVYHFRTLTSYILILVVILGFLNAQP